MYLRQIKRPQGIYLAIQESYYDSSKKQSRTRTIESIGYLENLRKEKRHSSIVVGLSKSELDEVAIQSIATAVVDGDYEGFTKALLKGVQTALKSKDDEIKRLQLEATERPHNEGSAPKTITREELAAMSPEEKQKFYNEHRELYESMYK